MIHSEVMEDPHRKARLALLLSWRILRQSVAMGRPITLPNLLRLHARLSPAYQATDRIVDRDLLRAAYLRWQPFRRGIPAAPPRSGTRVRQKRRAAR